MFSWLRFVVMCAVYVAFRSAWDARKLLRSSERAADLAGIAEQAIIFTALIMLVEWLRRKRLTNQATGDGDKQSD